jgi:hypothetical protein
MNYFYTMSLEEKTRLLLAFDSLVNRKVKGNAADYASRLGISIRTFFRLLEYIRLELDVPVNYCTRKRLYEYEVQGRIFVGFLPDQTIADEGLRDINGGCLGSAVASDPFKNIFSTANGWQSFRLGLQ